MKSFRKELWFQCSRATWVYVNITSQVEACWMRRVVSGGHGIESNIAMHITASVFINNGDDDSGFAS
jgi:thiamine phosphate synthase YjbQ (UPF0047 family)